MAVSVIVLQAFPHERGAARRSSQQESARACIACGPRQIADALQAEHGVEDVERYGWQAMVAIGRPCRDPGADRTRFVDALLQDLAVLGLFVVAQLARILWGIELAHVRVDTDL